MKSRLAGCGPGLAGVSNEYKSIITLLIPGFCATD
jgi:hypothetical protein